MIRRLLPLFVLAAPLGAQLPLPHGFAVASTVSMRIWVPSGKVRVETWDRDSISVTGKIGPRAHFFGGGAGRGAKLGVEADNPKDTALPSADLVVTVPRKAHVWIKMTEGEVTAINTAGELEVFTVSGSVLVQDATGVISVEAIDATVTLAGIGGDVRVRGGGGKIMLSQIRGTLSVSTVSGAVELSGSALQDARIETIGGAITVRGTVAVDALLDLETHSGPVSLFVDRSAAPSLSLATRSGTIKNPLGATKGKAGQITVHSFKGNINVVVVSGIEGKKAGLLP